MKNIFGKGMESLIPNKVEQNKKTFPNKKEAIFYIEIEKIKSNPYQPRKEFDQEGLKSLSESIREHGILQPLIVTKTEKEVAGGAQTEYQLVAGERRLLASKMIGMPQVPVIIREQTDQEKLEVSLIENLQRIDLGPMEKAEAFKKLEKEFGFTHSHIAELAGSSRPVVTNAIRLLDLPKEIQQAIQERKISEGHARAILMAKEPSKQRIVFAKILKNGLNVREAEGLVQKLEVWQPKKRTLDFIEEFQDLEKEVKKTFGIKTLKFGTQSGKPKLTIFFDTKKEIEDLLKKINPRK